MTTYKLTEHFRNLSDVHDDYASAAIGDQPSAIHLFGVCVDRLMTAATGNYDPYDRRHDTIACVLYGIDDDGADWEIARMGASDIYWTPYDPTADER